MAKINPPGGIAVNHYQISLSDRSAEAYFAQIILGRLLGRGNVMVSAITGVIGEESRDDQEFGQLNFPLEIPQGMAEKIQFAAATGLFERIVLPMGKESRDAAEEALKSLDVSNRDDTGNSPVSWQKVEVVYAKDLRSLGDHVHLYGWRRQRYIRCPEVEWAIHGDGRPGLIHPSEDKRVRDVIARLASNASPVIKLEVAPAVLASALCYIDDRLHVKAPVLTAPLSWLFINVSQLPSKLRWDDEMDLFFWELFFKGMGIGSGQFMSFLKRPGREEAVGFLTGCLNRLVPTQIFHTGARIS